MAWDLSANLHDFVFDRGTIPRAAVLWICPLYIGARCRFVLNQLVHFRVGVSDPTGNLLHLQLDRSGTKTAERLRSSPGCSLGLRA